MSLFEKFGSLYAVFTQDKAHKIVNKIKDDKLPSITSGNFSTIYQHEISALLNTKKLIIIKNNNPNCDLYGEYKTQKEIFRCIKGNTSIRIPEPYGFLDLSDEAVNFEQFMFMEYIEGKTLYRIMQEEFLRIHNNTVNSAVHEKDDLTVDKTIKHYIKGFDENHHIQVKFLTLFGELQDHKGKLSSSFKEKLSTLIEKIDTSIGILNSNGYSHNDLYQNPRNIIDDGTLIDFGLTTKHSGEFTTNDTFMIKDLHNLISTPQL